MRRLKRFVNAVAERRAAKGIVFDGDAPAVVLSPHLDDAVLSCWTVLESPGELTVANVCTGQPAAGSLGTWDRLTGARDSAQRMHERRTEDEAALALAGRAALHLDLLDGQYRAGARLRPAPVLERLAGAISRASLLYAPLAIGGHADHEAVRAAAIALARRGLPVHFYADLPYAVRYGWPRWVTGDPASEFLDAEAYWQPWLEPVEAASGGLTPRVRELTPDATARKRAAIECYRTQLPALDGGHLNWVTHPVTLRYEVSWEPA